MAKASTADVAAARQAIAKKYGKGIVVSMTAIEDVDVISSGIILLDGALGVGGFPRGRIAELFGPPSSGKSTTSLYLVKACQDGGELVAYFDFEHAFDKRYADLLGVDTSEDKFMLIQPENLEQGMKIMEDLIEGNLIGLAVVDSLAAMATVKELEGEIGDTHVALQARAMAQVLRRLTSKVSHSNCVVVFINHVREMIGGMPGRMGVTRRTTPGGTALKFYSSVRIELTPAESIKGKVKDIVSGKMVDGSVALRVKATVVKNKVAPPYRIGTFIMRAGQGVSQQSTVLEVAEARGWIKRSGGRYVLPFRNPNTGNAFNIGGHDNVLKWCDEYPEQYAKLLSKVREAVNDIVTTAPPPQETEPEPESDEEVEAATQQELEEAATLVEDSTEEPTEQPDSGTREVSIATVAEETANAPIG